MKKTKIDKQKLAQWWLRIYWAGIVVAMLTMLLQTVSVVSTTKASTPTGQTEQNAQAVTTSLTFQEYACKLIKYADPVIWILVSLTIIIAGIIYATSMGQTGGELSIGLAKQMIVAALTGVVLYLLSGLLLGTCGSTAGGWIARLLFR